MLNVQYQYDSVYTSRICARTQGDAKFVEMMLRYLPAPVLTTAWEAQRSERLQQLATQHGKGDHLAAALAIFGGAKSLPDKAAKREQYRDGVALLEDAVESGTVRAAAMEKVEEMLEKSKKTLADLTAGLGQHPEDAAIADAKAAQAASAFNAKLAAAAAAGGGGASGAGAEAEEAEEAEEDVDASAVPPPPPPSTAGAMRRPGAVESPTEEARHAGVSRRAREAAQLPLGVLFSRLQGEELRDALRIRKEETASGTNATPRMPAATPIRSPHYGSPLSPLQGRGQQSAMSAALQQPEIAGTKLANLGFDGQALAAGDITLADIFARLVSTTLLYGLLCCAMLCYAVLCCAVFCCAVPCCAVLSALADRDLTTNNHHDCICAVFNRRTQMRCHPTPAEVPHHTSTSWSQSRSPNYSSRQQQRPQLAAATSA
jgi:hypothetical protein